MRLCILYGLGDWERERQLYHIAHTISLAEIPFDCEQEEAQRRELQSLLKYVVCGKRQLLRHRTGRIRQSTRACAS
jgi:hypothetical protein